MPIADTLAELRAQRGALTAPIEGFEDILRLNTEGPTREAAADLLGRFRGRVGVLDQAISLLTILIDDGYPDLPRREVAQGVFDDVDANLSTITSARGFFTAASLATTLNLAPGTVRPK